MQRFNFQPSQSKAKSLESNTLSIKRHQTLLLEPILTPSGIIDVGEDVPDSADIDLSGTELDLELDLDIDADLSDDIGLPDVDDLPDDDLEDVEFITALGETLSDKVSSQFEAGVFTIGDRNEVTIDYLFDSGLYEGELAIFSLEGMEDLAPGSEAFIQEAASRSLSDSELGHIVIADKTDGARFSGSLGEADQNRGDYAGAKTFEMKAGDRFAFMLVPKGEVEEVFDNPNIGGAKHPLFSLATANPEDGLHVGQIADVTGNGNTFVFEDMRVDGKSDTDYNDLVIQVRGATGEAPLMDDLIEPGQDWRDSEVGQAILNHAEQAFLETLIEDIDLDIEEVADESTLTIETDSSEFLEEFDLVIDTPETLLEWEQQNLSEDFQTSLDTVTALVESDIEALPDNPDAYFEDVVIEDLPGSLAEEFDNLDNTAQAQLAEQDAALQQSQNELQQAVDEVTEDFTGLDGAVDELTQLLTESMDEMPEELVAEIDEFKALIAEVEGELLADLDVDSIIDDVGTLAANAEDALADDENTLSNPLFVGQGELLDLEDSDHFQDFDFPKAAQPLVGVVDTGFAADNPDIDYTRIQVGRDYVDGDENSLLAPGEGDGHGTHVLGVIGATQANGVGIDGTNDEAPLWVSRAVDSGQWANALTEFTEAFQASAQPNAVINLSFDLVQIDADGNEVPRYELTDYEREALAAAQQAGVLVVVSAGNENGIPSALGQASLEFDNVITVGAVGLSDAGIEEAIHHGALLSDLQRADYSNYGESLSILAAGGSEEDPVYSTVEDGVGIMSGTSVATAKVTGAASLVWAANPELTYQQVIDILKQTAIDLSEEGWDADTGAGLLDIAAAVNLALITTPNPKNQLTTDKPSFLLEDEILPDTYERPAFFKKIKRGLKKIGKGIKKGFKKVGKGIKKATKKIRRGFKKFTKSIGKFAKRASKKIFRGIKKVGSFIGRAVKKTTRFVKKAARYVWNGVKYVARQTWDKLQGIYYRTTHWFRQLPKRVRRLFQGLWEAVKSLKPWSLSWWKSLGKARTWKDFLKWVTKNLVHIGEIIGVRELFDTLQDFYRFKSRPLTGEERSWARSVFGNAIDYDVVRLLKDSDVVNEGANATNKLNLIVFPDDKAIVDHIFIHEMVHVWQYQSNSYYDNRAIGSGQYDYGGLSALKKLKDNDQTLLTADLGREGQAEIIQDYYILKTGRDTFHLNGKPNGARFATSPADLPLYVYFVRDASSLSEAQLMGVGDGKGVRSPHLFREAYDEVDGFDKEIYPEKPAKGAYRSGNRWVQDFITPHSSQFEGFTTQPGDKVRLILEDDASFAYWSQDIGNTDDFVGSWTNVDANTRGMTRAEITKGGDDTLTVHTWGKCHPTDCDHGAVTVPFTGNPTTVVQNFSFMTTTLTITEEAGELKIVSDNRFTDGTNRDYVAEYSFSQS